MNPHPAPPNSSAPSHAAAAQPYTPERRRTTARLHDQPRLPFDDNDEMGQERPNDGSLLTPPPSLI